MAKGKKNEEGKRRAKGSAKKKQGSGSRFKRTYTPLPHNEIFPFTELPAEIRNRIYSYHLASDTRYNLANFAVPAICSTNRQLRKESLPVLFAERSWYVNIGSNLQDRYNDRKGDVDEEDEKKQKQIKSRMQNSGVTKMKAGLRSFLLTAVKMDVIFRDITFCVVKVEDLYRVGKIEANAHGYDDEDKDDYVVIEFSALWVNDGTADVSITETAHHPDNDEYAIGFEAEDIEIAAQEAKNATERCAAESDDFKGFRLHDLEKMAKPFRFSKVDKEVEAEEKSYDWFEKCLVASKKVQSKPKFKTPCFQPPGKRFEAREKAKKKKGGRK